MFGWFAKWFKRKDVNPYTEKERLLYRYFDGQKKVSADPMILYCRLMEVGTDLKYDIDVTYSASNDKLKAREKMIGKIHKIFSLKPYEEGGLTQGEAENLLVDFVDWCEALKKNGPNSPTSPMAPLPPTPKPTLGGGSQATPNTFPSGLTGEEFVNGEWQ
jgi:hypothetical protein